MDFDDLISQLCYKTSINCVFLLGFVVIKISKSRMLISLLIWQIRRDNQPKLKGFTVVEPWKKNQQNSRKR